MSFLNPSIPTTTLLPYYQLHQRELGDDGIWGEGFPVSDQCKISFLNFCFPCCAQCLKAGMWSPHKNSFERQFFFGLRIWQKLHSEALARKRKEEKKRKERKGVCERSCSWARAASGAVVHSSSSSSWQKQRVLALTWWGWWTTLQYRQMRRLFSIFHLVQLCQRQVVGEQLLQRVRERLHFFAKLKLQY